MPLETVNLALMALAKFFDFLSTPQGQKVVERWLVRDEEFHRQARQLWQSIERYFNAIRQPR